MQHDCTAAKAEYISTKKSLQKLSEEFGIPLVTLSRRCRKEKWVELRTQTEHKLLKKAVKKRSESKINFQATEADYRQTLYDLAYTVASQLVDMTNKNTVEDLTKIGLKPKDITGAIKDLGDILHVKSDDDIAEQKARIKSLQKQVDEVKNDEKKIIIEGVPSADEVKQ